MNLPECREALDAIDRELIPLLERRMTVARRIGRIKAEQQLPVYQPEREKQVLETRLAWIADESLKPFLSELLRAILAVSRSVQQADDIGKEG